MKNRPKLLRRSCLRYTSRGVVSVPAVAWMGSGGGQSLQVDILRGSWEEKALGSCAFNFPARIIMSSTVGPAAGNSSRRCRPGTVFRHPRGDLRADGWRIHAYVLMSRHYHFLLQTPEPNLFAGISLKFGPFSPAPLAGHHPRNWK
jgi:hypothetical protein